MERGVSVVLIKSRDGAVLMQHRDNNPNVAYPDYWGVPGGRADKSERDLKAAAVRELKEETGYVADEKDLLFVCKEIQTIKGVEILRSIYCGLYDNKQEINCFEGSEMRFVHPSEFKNMKVVETHVDFIRQAEGILFVSSIERRV